MGRPINKKYFGDPAQSGGQIALSSAWIPGEVGAVDEAYIVKQVGTGRYLATDGVNSGVVRLVEAGTLTEGQAHLIVKPYGAAVQYAKVIFNRTIKTWEGNVFKWSASAAAATGEVDMPFNTDIEATGSISYGATGPMVGVAFTVVSSGVSDDDGSITKAYQWKRATTSNGTYSNITDATSVSYTPVSDDEGKYLKCQITTTDALGGVTVLLSSASAVVVTDTEATGTLAVSPAAQVGVLSTATPSITDADGSLTYAYQWLLSASTSDANYSAISGATSATYTALLAQVGKYLKCQVTTTDAKGGTTVILSTPTAVLAA